jgi:hypothetical protein
MMLQVASGVFACLAELGAVSDTEHSTKYIVWNSKRWPRKSAVACVAFSLERVYYLRIGLVVGF